MLEEVRRIAQALNSIASNLNKVSDIYSQLYETSRNLKVLSSIDYRLSQIEERLKQMPQGIDAIRSIDKTLTIYSIKTTGLTNPNLATTQDQLETIDE